MCVSTATLMLVTISRMLKIGSGAQGELKDVSLRETHAK